MRAGVTALTQTEGRDQFYPTPPDVAEKMLKGIEWNNIATALEPSAGKGDLVKAVYNIPSVSDRYRRERVEIDCIELDPYLQQILKHNFSEMEAVAARLVHDDFLTFRSHKCYDLILMNPPFANGDKHLLKALEIQKNGGQIVCLLNAETIRNPYSNTRKLLLQKLNEHEAQITYLADAFAEAERRADVDVAIVRVEIPNIRRESTFFNRMKEAVQQAVEDLKRKLFSKKTVEERVGEFVEKFPSRDKEYPNADLFEWHGLLTLSYETGRRIFVKERGISLDDSMTIDAFIALTENAWGAETVRELKKSYDGASRATEKVT